MVEHVMVYCLFKYFERRTSESDFLLSSIPEVFARFFANVFFLIFSLFFFSWSSTLAIFPGFARALETKSSKLTETDFNEVSVLI